MEQNSKTYSLPSIDWARERLGVADGGAEVKPKALRREALVSFLNELQANDFSAPVEAQQALELICGEPPASPQIFAQQRQQQQLKQLDQLVLWFADRFTVTDHQRLLSEFGQQLTAVDTKTASPEVQAYQRKIWQAAESVVSATHEDSPPVKKILQAVFHISTTRPSQRNVVRREYVAKLKQRYTEAQLSAARLEVERRHVIPDLKFHRPFLSMLTSSEESVEAYRLRQQIVVGTETVPYAPSFNSAAMSGVRQSEEKKESSPWWVLFIVLVVIGGFAARASRAINRYSEQPQPQRTLPSGWTSNNNGIQSPKISFDPSVDPKDPRSAESALKVLRKIRGEDGDLPTLEEFSEIKEKALRAQEKIDRRLKAKSEAERDWLASEPGDREKTDPNVLLPATAEQPSAESGLSDVESIMREVQRREQKFREQIRNSERFHENARKRAEEYLKQREAARNPHSTDPLKTVDDIMERMRKDNERRQKELEDSMRRALPPNVLPESFRQPTRAEDLIKSFPKYDPLESLPGRARGSDPLKSFRQRQQEMLERYRTIPGRERPSGLAPRFDPSFNP